ncbi:hypothetical protein QQ045_017481 [Rhodiola kirilowii]
MRCLHQWSSSTFGEVKKKIEKLKELIQQVKEESRTDETATRESKLSEELDEWLEREELWWRQRLRAEWLWNGNRNTTFFHAKASQRRRRNYIDHLRNTEGELCESEQQFNSIVFNYFASIFQSQVDSRSERWR